MMTEIISWSLTTAPPPLRFTIDLPNDWTEHPRSVQQPSLSTTRPSVLANLRGSSTPGRFKAIAIPLTHDVNATDIGLTYLLNPAITILGCDGEKLPTGKIGRFAYESARGGRGRLLATRNGGYVLLLQMETTSEAVALDEALGSFRFAIPDAIPLAATTLHEMAGFEFQLPDSWHATADLEATTACLFRQANEPDGIILVETCSVDAAAQCALRSTLSQLEKVGVRYAGSVLVPTPNKPSVERSRFQSSCTMQGKEGVVLAMHHREQNKCINIVACLPLAKSNPMRWAIGKYALEMALSTICSI